MIKMKDDRLRDYPKIRMNVDPSASKARQVLASQLRQLKLAFDEKHVAECKWRGKFKEEISYLIKFCYWSETIDDRCHNILQCFVFAGCRRR